MASVRLTNLDIARAHLALCFNEVQKISSEFEAAMRELPADSEHVMELKKKLEAAADRQYEAMRQLAIWEGLTMASFPLDLDRS